MLPGGGCGADAAGLRACRTGRATARAGGLRRVKALIATSMYPHAERPALGTFVRTQVESLRHAGLDVDVLFLQGGKSKYLRGAAELRRRLDAGRFDLVHAHYSYVGVLARTQWQVPVVVTYHGDDLLGTVTEDGTHSARSRAAVAVGKALARAVEAVIVQTDEMAAKLRRRDVHVIPHEVDLDLFRPVPREAARAELGLHPHRPYLL